MKSYLHATLEMRCNYIEVLGCDSHVGMGLGKVVHSFLREVVLCVWLPERDCNELAQVLHVFLPFSAPAPLQRSGTVASHQYLGHVNPTGANFSAL